MCRRLHNELLCVGRNRRVKRGLRQSLPSGAGKAQTLWRQLAGIANKRKRPYCSQVLMSGQPISMQGVGQGLVQRCPSNSLAALRRALARDSCCDAFGRQLDANHKAEDRTYTPHSRASRSRVMSMARAHRRISPVREIIF